MGLLARFWCTTRARTRLFPPPCQALLRAPPARYSLRVGSARSGDLRCSTTVDTTTEARQRACGAQGGRRGVIFDGAHEGPAALSDGQIDAFPTQPPPGLRSALPLRIAYFLIICGRSIHRNLAFGGRCLRKFNFVYPLIFGRT